FRFGRTADAVHRRLRLRLPRGRSERRRDAGRRHVGNLAIIPKLLLYEDEQTAVAVGVGIEAPTGSDAEARVAFTAYRLENEAVHLHPYLGILAHPTDDFFAHAFVQIDVAANGNPVEFAAVGGAPGAGTFGVYNEQTLLHVDLSLGHWLYRDPCAPWLT